MAQTAWAAGLQVSRWANELAHKAGKLIYFNRFMAEDPNVMIQVKNELNGKPGKDVTVGLITNPSGAGVTSDNTLEGNEEALSTYAQTVTLEQYRHAIRNTGNFDDRKVLYNFRKEALGALKIWLAEKVDGLIFTALGTSPTRTFRADAGGDAVYDRLNEASTTAQLTASDVISLDDISALKRAAKVPKGADEMKIRPIRVDGNEHYVLLIHPEQSYDLFRDSAWQQAQREAQRRGDSNPLFKGALGIWDGVVIHEHENITTSSTYGAGSVHGAQALFLGAQAGIFAKGNEPIWVEKTFDYGNSLGVAGGQIMGVSKTTFNGEDFACIAYYTACTQLS